MPIRSSSLGQFVTVDEWSDLYCKTGLFGLISARSMTKGPIAGHATRRWDEIAGTSPGISSRAWSGSSMR
jgi:hypothetical protein